MTPFDIYSNIYLPAFSEVNTMVCYLKVKQKKSNSSTFQNKQKIMVRKFNDNEPVKSLKEEGREVKQK